MVANPDGGVAVLYAAGHLVGGSDTTFAGYLALGDTDGWVMGDDQSLEDALAATVTVVVRDHGPARPTSSPTRFEPSAPATPPAPTCRCRCTPELTEQSARPPINPDTR
jgi:hypothetical protein